MTEEEILEAAKERFAKNMKGRIIPMYWETAPERTRAYYLELIREDN